MSEYGVIILGGTGQVGSAVVKRFINSPSCREVVLLSRRPIANSWGERVRVVTVDPEKADFAEEVAALVRACAPRVMFGVSCVGVGSGSSKWSDEELIKLEVGIVGAFARGCKAGGVTNFGLLTAAGTNRKSKIRYARVMGLKEEAVQEIGFSRLAIFRPGIIGGNAHTPGWVAFLGRFIPGSWGTIDQEAIGRAFVGSWNGTKDQAPRFCAMPICAAIEPSGGSVDRAARVAGVEASIRAANLTSLPRLRLKT